MNCLNTLVYWDNKQNVTFLTIIIDVETIYETKNYSLKLTF